MASSATSDADEAARSLTSANRLLGVVLHLGHRVLQRRLHRISRLLGHRADLAGGLVELGLDGLIHQPLLAIAARQDRSQQEPAAEGDQTRGQRIALGALAGQLRTLADLVDGLGSLVTDGRTDPQPFHPTRAGG